VSDLSLLSKIKTPIYFGGDAEFQFHTDSCYRVLPEEYSARLVIRAPRNSEGLIGIVNGRAVINHLESTSDGRRSMVLLADGAIPIMIPYPFTGYRQEREYIFAPVISRTSPLIRFDYAAMRQSVLNKHKHPIEALWALNVLQKAVNEIPARMKLSLREGDVLFLNNHTMLNATTPYTDTNRLLKRIGLHSR
jgi:hypothetical protein